MRLLFILTILIFSFDVNSQYYEHKELSKSFGYRDVKYEDLNNDGILDIIALGMDLSYYLGLGNNNYSMKYLLHDTLYISTIAHANSVLLNDLDHNGFLDIIYPSELTNEIYIQFNDNMSFRKDSLNNTFTDLGNIQLIDQNLDGEMDIVTSHVTDVGYAIYKRMGLFLNTGNGNFNNGGELNSPDINFESNTEIVDYNNDGISELLAINQNYPYPASYYLYEFSDAPIVTTYSFPYPVPSQTSDVAFMDIDENGLPDFIFAYNGYGTSLHWHQMTDLSIATFTEATIPPRPNASLIHCADVNGDGREDFLLCTNSTIHWYTVSTTGIFNYQGILFNGIQVGSLSDIKIIDVNNDNYKDIVLIGSQAVWHVLNNGNYQFLNKKEILKNPYSPNYFKVVDIDNDGLDDLLYCSGFYSDDALIWQKNLGNNQFSEDNIIGQNNFSILQNYEVNDIDNDGDNDIIMCGSLMINNVYNEGKLAILFNDGLGGFNNRLAIEPSNVIDITIADFNNDGRKDIATISNGNTGFYKMSYYINNGNSTSFSTNNISLETIPKREIESADVNNDGKIDLLVDYDGKIMVYLNNSNSFSTSNSYLINRKQFGFKVADFDNDGDSDILKTKWTVIQNTFNYINSYVLLKNNGSGQFLDSIEIENSLDNSQNIRNFRVFDLNQDGKFDFFGMIENKIFYYQNNGNGNFLPRSLKYESAYDWNNVEVADIHNDGTNEIIYSNAEHGFIRSMKEVFTGNLPVLNQSSLNVCSGESFQIVIQNANELNDNTTWGLFSDSCGGNLITTSGTGVFNLSSFYATTYFIKAIGGIQFSGPCSVININLISEIQPPNLITNINGSSSIDFNWNSTDPNITGWQYSLNNGLNWNSLPLTQNNETVNNLNPNTCYDLLLRAAGNNSTCNQNPAALSTVCLPCQNFVTYDTAYVCRENHFMFPDGSFVSYINATETRICQFQSIFGCDSIVHFTAFVPTTNYSLIIDTICSGSDYTFADGSAEINIQNDLVWSVNVTNIYGCTDWVEYYLTVLSTEQIDSTYQICNNSSITFGDGQTFSNPQENFTYSYNLNLGGNCYTTVVNTVIVYQAYEIIQNEIICYGSNYNFSDGSVIFEITEPVEYVMYNQTLNGCDSIIQVNLNFPPSETVLIRDTICSGSSYTFYDGTVISNILNSLDTTITYLIQQNCDYNVNYQIEVIQSGFIDTTIQVCQNSNITLANGEVFTNVQQNFVYTYSTPISGNCGSTTQVNVIVSPAMTTNVTDTVCPGSSYTFPDGYTINNLTSSTTYSLSLQNTLGCDSIVNYTINIPSTNPLTITQSICQGQSYILYDGNVLNNLQSNLDTTITYQSSQGCSFDVNYFLIVIPNLTVDSIIQLCQNSSITFEDGVSFDSIQENFLYNYSTISNQGCLVNIQASILVNQSSTLTLFDTICEGQTYNFYGEDLTNTGLYSNTLLSEFNCDSVIVLNLNVIECNANINNLNSEDLRLYPNPTQSIVYSSKNIDFKVRSISGQILISGYKSQIIDLEEFSPGVYFIEVLKDGKVTQIEKVVKN